MIDKALSDKIKVGGLCCAMIVVLRHAVNLKAFYGTELIGNWVAYIELFISKMTEMAVPYFFIISGFFFFKTTYYSIEAYRNMLLKKGRTLLIPYLSWIIIGHIVMIPVGLGELPTSFNGYLLAIWDAQCAGVLWYVRSLLLMMMLYPLYGWIFIANNKFLYCIIMCIFVYLWMPVDMRPLSTEGIFFFLFGGICQKFSLLNRFKVNAMLLLAIFASWLLLTYYSLSFDLWTNRLCTISGILAVWLVLDKIRGVSFKLMLRYSGMAFFLYVAHIYVLKLSKHAIASLCPDDNIAAFASFLILPITTIVIIISLGILIKAIAPKIFNVITGGRS